jgi:hypothetical protein
MTSHMNQEAAAVNRRLPRTKFPGKTERKSFSLTPVATKKLSTRPGEYRFLSESDTVEQLIRTHL